MIATHSIKINGVWYTAGMKIPAVDPVGKEREFSFSKTEIQRKSVSELKEIAEKLGIDGFESMTGSRLKKILIEKFGL